MYMEIFLSFILLVALSAASVLCANIKFKRKKKVLHRADSERFITEKNIEDFDYLPFNSYLLTIRCATESDFSFY